MPDFPDLTADEGWTVAIDGVDPALEPARDVRLAMVDGVIGTLGSPLVGYEPAKRETYVSIYTGAGAEERLLVAPDWTPLAGRLDAGAPVRRVLDLRTGLLHHEFATELGHVRAVSFASRARPGIGVLRAVGEGARSPRRMPVGVCLKAASGGAAIAIGETRHGAGDERTLDRIVAVRASSRRVPALAEAQALLNDAAEAGFDRLLEEQRRAWAVRWADADIRIDGDPQMQQAVRFAIFEMLAHAPDRGEAAIGARGLTGTKYRGHVFWDTDVFVLPFLAATRPRAARAVLEYRVRRLPAARQAAREDGFAGARIPWESAVDGRDVTPDWIDGPDGLPLHVLTGKHEIHITSDVAWAAATYADWTGDDGFAAGPGAELLYDTARYWASRLERAADGSAHLSDVIGPDEYHNLICDNAFTNVMARWNLRRAAQWLVSVAASTAATAPTPSSAPTSAERKSWFDLADRVVDRFDPSTGLFEQFDGFFDLEPVKIAELTTRPVSGEVFLGRDRVASTQCVKQPDVLMLYHLISEELAPNTLAANLDFYDPRTSFGSSLAPAIHAALMARAGRPDAAIATLRMTARMDLDDDQHTEEGLHMAAFGGLWQAIVLGFAGIRPVVRPSGPELTVDPHLPSTWQSLEVPFRFRGRRVRLHIEHDRLTVASDRPITIRVGGGEPVEVSRAGSAFARSGTGWSPAR